MHNQEIPAPETGMARLHGSDRQLKHMQIDDAIDGLNDPIERLTALIQRISPTPERAGAIASAAPKAQLSLHEFLDNSDMKINTKREELNDLIHQVENLIF